MLGFEVSYSALFFLYNNITSPSHACSGRYPVERDKHPGLANEEEVLLFKKIPRRE